MIQKIKLDKETNNYKMFLPDSINNLAKVNLIVGQNNSGKSTLLRTLFSDNELNFIPYDLKINDINNITNEFYTCIKDFLTKNNITSFGNIHTKIKEYKPIEYISNNFISKSHIQDKLTQIKLRNQSINTNSLISIEEVNNYIEYYTNKTLEKLDLVISNEYNYQFDSIYIPTLRGLRPIPKNTNDSDYFKERTIDDYFKLLDIKDQKSIYTGLSFYSELHNLRVTSSETIKQVESFQKFLSENFFDNKPILLIPKKGTDVVHININNEGDFPIYRLGEGIQMIIILTYPLFFNNQKRLNVYIEEPELFLHPGMQRILLDSFTNNKLFPHHQFFISTHSNHFLDMTADYDNISIYTLEKNNISMKFMINNIETADSDVLNLLGVKNSSVFLSNCTIWVEGITDRIYLRKYLEIYYNYIGQRNIKEDFHYSFVEYSGNNITHWSFLKSAFNDVKNINVDRLCGKVFLITDKDGAGLKVDGSIDHKLIKSKKTLRHEFLTEKLGKRYYCLKCREIENLLPQKIVLKVIQQLEKNINLKFKTVNDKIYKSIPLGTFIENKCDGIKHKYASDSGSIRDKVKFCQLAISQVNSISDMSDEAVELCKNINSFIIEMNNIII